ncbi:unnamed protein product [Calypogeia fissa]
MSRRQELCRDFLRGNCRYGSRCKFLHELPQQQNSQQQQKYNQQKNQYGGAGNYYNVLGNNANNSNQRQPQNQNNVSKEHRCNDPRICKEQIKEDRANEHPVFWRLTCYAHYKFLENDIVGDVSPEELRALAYEGAKQGLSLHDVVQREKSMMAAKSAEFDALLRNPYNGPAQNSQGFQSSSFSSSPFLSPLGKPSTFAPFGQPANLSTAGPPQVFTQVPFGGASAAPFSFGQPSGDVPFGKQAATLSSANPSPFGQQTNVFQQSPFGGIASPARQSPFGGNVSLVTQNPFGGTASTGSQSPFPNLQGPRMVSNPNAFQSPSLSGLGSTNKMNFPPNQSLSDFSTRGSPAGFQNPNTTPDLNTPSPVSQTSPGTSLQAASVNTQDNAIWLKAVWKIGEIPEGEPPAEVRF